MIKNQKLKLTAILSMLLYAFLVHADNTVQTPFDQADEFFKQRADENKAREALKIYRKVYSEQPDNYEAAWRLSMACYFVGIRLTKETEAKKSIFNEGYLAGKKASTLNDRCAQCFFWSAINLALWADEIGSIKVLMQIKEIRAMLQTSISINSRYAYGGAYRLLGLIEQKLPGVLGGSHDDAKKYFEKAIHVAPDEPLNYLFLAKHLDEVDKNRKEALKIAQRGLEVPPPLPERLEAIDALKDLKEFVQSRM